MSKITLVRAEIEVIHNGPVRYPQESTDSPLLDIALKMLSFVAHPEVPQKKKELTRNGDAGDTWVSFLSF